MRWNDVQVGDVLLDIDADKFTEATDFVVLAKDGLSFTVFDLKSGVVEREVFPDIAIPGFYDVIRGDQRVVLHPMNWEDLQPGDSLIDEGRIGHDFTLVYFDRDDLNVKWIIHEEGIVVDDYMEDIGKEIIRSYTVIRGDQVIRQGCKSEGE